MSHHGSDLFSPTKLNGSGKKGLQNRRQPRKPTIVIKQGIKFIGLIHKHVPVEVEIANMEASEVEQCKHGDRFWGLDKESKNCNEERILMEGENDRSGALQKYFRYLEQHKRWDDDYRQESYSNACISAVAEMTERKKYISKVISTTSSDVVMNYKWKTKEYISPVDNGNDTGLDLENLFGKTIDRKNAIETLTSTISFDNLDRMSLALPETDSEIPLSIHLDGIQKSKALINNNKPENKLGTTLRNRTITSIAEKALTYSKDNDSDTTSKEGSITTGIKSNRRTNLIVEKTLKNINGKEIKLPPPPLTKHIEEIHGHIKYKWDQELMLRASFAKMTDGRDLLSFQDLAINVSSNTSIKELLRFTVFGSVIKRKQFDFFKDIFISMNNHDSSFGSYQNYSNSAKLITVNNWLQFAYDTAVQKNIIRRHIRTDIEHIEMCCSSSWTELLGECKEGWYAAQSRKILQRNDRIASVSRQLSIGDIVWGLHGRGVVWLPAIVNEINEHTYDVTYFITQNSFMKGKVAAETKPLLSLPSMLNSAIMKPSKSSNETEIVASVFDLIDIDKTSKLLTKTLITALKSSVMENIVRTSVALSMLIYGDFNNGINKGVNFNNNNESDVSLISAFMECFIPSKEVNEYETLTEMDTLTDTGDDSTSFITKNEFIAFCSYCNDLKLYTTYNAFKPKKKNSKL